METSVQTSGSVAQPMAAPRSEGFEPTASSAEISVARIEQMPERAMEPHAETPDVRIMNEMANENLDIHEVMVKLANREFRDFPKDKIDSDKNIIDAEYIVLDDGDIPQAASEMSTDLKETTEEQQSPLGELGKLAAHDPRLREILKEEYVNSLQSGDEASYEEIAMRAKERYEQELAQKPQESTQKNDEDEKILYMKKPNTEFPSSIPELQSRINELTGQYTELAKNFAESRNQITSLQEQVLEMAMVLRLLLEDEDNEKSKKEKSILEAFLKMLYAMLVYIFVQDEEKQKEMLTDESEGQPVPTHKSTRRMEASELLKKVEQKNSAKPVFQQEIAA